MSEPSRIIRVAVLGAAGRMGQMVRTALAERPAECLLTGATEHPGHDMLGALVENDVPLVASIERALENADVMIDFTSPASTRAAVAMAAEHGVAAIVGTTGLGPAEEHALDDAAARIPVLVASNFSLGVNLVALLVEQAARILPQVFDAEVLEIHHRAKRDAPSGTAYTLAQAVAAGRDQRLAAEQVLSRSDRDRPRRTGEIGIQSLRGGDVVGEHAVHFLGPDERIELVHKASSRAIFARGAVQAALFAAGQPAGRYGMAHVLGLTP